MKIINNYSLYKCTFFFVVSEYVSSLLSDNRGVCFVVEPSCVDLPAFGSTILKITAYSNMWGEYQDELLCSVSTVCVCVFPLHNLSCF